MTDGERALQFWSVLALAARNQSLVSYKQLDQLTGMAAVGAGRPLGHINAYCRLHKMPQLNLIAVSQETGKPEADFLQGVELEIEQARVFVYDWEEAVIFSKDCFRTSPMPSANFAAAPDSPRLQFSRSRWESGRTRPSSRSSIQSC
jgi:hypothetical protein